MPTRLLNLNEVKLMSAAQPATNNGDRTRLGDFFEALVALSLQTYVHRLTDALRAPELMQRLAARRS